MRRKRRLTRGEIRKRNKKIIISTICLLFIFSVGYGAFQAVLNVNVMGNIKIPTECVEGKVWEFSQRDEEQEFIVPCSGVYKVELWGAGGNMTWMASSAIGAGNGGYVSGKINFKMNRKYYVYVGDSDTHSVSTNYNGGGGGERPGGGATDIRAVNGNWKSFVSLKSRIMVASGGGGGFHKDRTSNHKPGHGGGLVGYDADADYSVTYQSPLLKRGYSGHGGTQTRGGLADITAITTGYHSYYNTNEITQAKFGIGGYAGYSSGGGGGYYGGGHGIHPGSTWSGGGGGSSFISGHDGCDAISEQSTEDNIIHTGQSIHYSGLYFTDTVMIDGAGYKWTDHKLEDLGVVGMPTHDGTGTITGNSGDGFAKITLLTRKPN